MSENTSNEMEYGANRPSRRSERKQALLWRLVLLKQARQAHLSKLHRDARSKFNTNNKPLGA